MPTTLARSKVLKSELVATLKRSGTIADVFHELTLSCGHKERRSAVVDMGRSGQPVVSDVPAFLLMFLPPPESVKCYSCTYAAKTSANGGR